MVQELNQCHVLEKEPFVIWELKLVQRLLLLVMTTLWNVILRSTRRDDVADAANAVKEHLTADPEVYANPEKYFDEVIEIEFRYPYALILTDLLRQI